MKLPTVSLRIVMLASLSLALLVSLSLAQEPAENWPCFRGPGGLATSKTKGFAVTWSDTDNIAWKTKLPGAGTSSPIVHGDHIYLTCYSGYNVPGERAGSQDDLRRHLVCLDRKTGKILWDTKTKAALPEQAFIRDNHGYASSTPAADKDHVYCFYGKSGVYAFTHEGKEVWHAEVGTRLNGWGSAASPVLYGDLVIINASVESDSLYALNKKTGKEVWKTKGMRESWNTPILVPLKDRTELVVAIQGKILGLDPTTGKQLWSCATNIGWYMVPSMVAKDGVVYCLGGRSGTAALAVRAGGEGDVTRTHRLWTSEKGSNVSSPIIHGDHLYYMNDSQSIAYCAEAKTGKIIYEERVGGRFGQTYSSPILAGGNLYYTSRTGQVLVVAAKPEYEKVALNDFKERSLFHACPAVTGNRLLIRSDRYLYCLEKK
jgi:hypothetical protein